MLNFKERRKELGKTQFDVAVECGVSLATVQKWDKGILNGIKAENRDALQKCLDLSEEELPAVWDYRRRKQ